MRRQIIQSPLKASWMLVPQVVDRDPELVGMPGDCHSETFAQHSLRFHIVFALFRLVFLFFFSPPKACEGFFRMGLLKRRVAPTALVEPWPCV